MTQEIKEQVEQEQEIKELESRWQNQKVYAVSLNCVSVGVWRNMRKMCVDMKITDLEFPSYWTLTRKRDETPIKFSTQRGEYALSIEKLK